MPADDTYPTPSRRVWGRLGMSRHRGPSPGSRERLPTAAGRGYGVSDRAHRRDGALPEYTEGFREAAGRPGGTDHGFPGGGAPAVRNLDSRVRAERQARAGSAPCHGATFSRNDRGRYTGMHSRTQSAVLTWTELRSCSQSDQVALMGRDGSRSWAQRQHTGRDERCPGRFRCGPEFSDSGGVPHWTRTMEVGATASTAYAGRDARSKM